MHSLWLEGISGGRKYTHLTRRENRQRHLPRERHGFKYSAAFRNGYPHITWRRGRHVEFERQRWALVTARDASSAVEVQHHEALPRRVDPLRLAEGSNAVGLEQVRKQPRHPRLGG